MSFSQQRNKIEKQIAKVNSVQEYQKEYLSAPIVNWLEELAGRYIYHLYNNLYGQETQKNLKAFLDDFYGASEDHAKNCISIAVDVEHLYGSKVKDWTLSSLPAFDNFLLKLINVVLGEKIMKSKKDVYEADTYLHLIRKGEIYQTIGQAFQSIYQMRNSFLHVQVEDENGVRRQIRWNNKKYANAKELIVFQYRTAFRVLDQLIN
ncbi:hypothetical protein [Algoriphagus halophilus]|uniref:Uncharacterized protein n=1 Tax=Algoriphagus halophilus TaxID=226505 RepID=A0A1N6D6F7_9BACT|nr:hypothetical protein [Algoriphagus halophilus]SIN66244.1 hypothetical protein SAMN05444394_0304 [Algoriphagus halophilus]